MRWRRSSVPQSPVAVVALCVALCGAVPAAAAIGRMGRARTGRDAAMGAPQWPTPPTTRASVDLVLRPGAGASGRAAVVHWLGRAGIRARPVGGALHVTSSTRILGRLLHVRFEDRRLGGSTVYGATSAPRLPLAVARQVASVLGLDDAPAATSDLALVRGAGRPGRGTRPPAPATTSKVLPRACPSAARVADTNPGASTLAKIGDHYGMKALRMQGYEGAGVTIAAFELAPVSRRAVVTYDRCFGLDPSNLRIRKVDTGGTPGQGTAEADVDVEQLQTQAPQARVLVYQGPNSRLGFYDTLAAIVDANEARVISIGWGLCERLDAGAIPPLHALFARAARQGQTVLVAAGDTGSEGCLADNGSTALAVQYPASDPFVTAVGGTAMRPGRSDTVWNACASAGSMACAAYGSSGSAAGAGGGGVSVVFRTEPRYQTSVGRFSGRAVPDLSADAGPAVVYADGLWTVGSGTSLSAPFVAGLVADVTPTYAAPIGDLAPKLYALQHVEGYGRALSAVRSGNNDFSDSYRHRDYRAGRLPGYSRAAGLGTPVASGFLGPQVLALSGETGVAGDTITIRGGHLRDTTVRFGDVPAKILAEGAGWMRVVVPPGSGTTTLVVSNPIGAAAPLTFTYRAPPDPAP